jgi:NADH-quinone oxidoreductase subunit H
MKFGWKLLIPVSIGWIMIVAAARALRNDVAIGNREILAGGAVIIVLLLLATWLIQARQDRKAAAQEQVEAESAARPFDAASGGFPVPPLPGQEFTYTSRRSLAGATTIVQDASIEPAITAQEGDHG